MTEKPSERILKLIRTLEAKALNLPEPGIVNYAQVNSGKEVREIDYEKILTSLEAVDLELKDVPTLFQDKNGNNWSCYREYGAWKGYSEAC